MQLSKIISTRIDNLSRRIIKIVRFGINDVQEPFQANNYGIDSNPIAGMVAVYSATTENGKNVIIGYLNKNQLAAPGETRVFSTDSQGALKTYIWLDSNGIIKMGGDADHAVRFSKLEQGFNQLKQDFNTFAASYTPGSPSTLGTPPTIAQSMASIADAKINEIKTP